MKVKTEDDQARYDELCTLFWNAFGRMDRLGAFDDTVSGDDLRRHRGSVLSLARAARRGSPITASSPAGRPRQPTRSRW